MIQSLLTHVPITFGVLIAGYFLGRIRIKGVSLDLAGVLVVAALAGFVLTSSELLGNFLNIYELKEDMDMLSSMGTSLFMSAIGVMTGYSLDLKNMKEIKSMLIGALMVVSAFASMKVIAFIDTDVPYSKLLGALCGALTTTPGLSAVNELPGIVAEDATVGYGSSYLFGVAATVLFVQIITREYKDGNESAKQNGNTSQAALGGLIQIGIAVLLGYLVGGIGFGTFSLGNSGGILFAGIAVGILAKTCLRQKIASAETMGTFRNLGLVMFFVGNGIPAGMSLRDGFEVKIFLYGLLMTIVPIAIGTALARLHNRKVYTAFVVAGGMTSTPAVGVLLQKRCGICLKSYSTAYVSALLTIIILIRAS